MSHKARRVLCDRGHVLLTVLAVKLAELTCRTLDDFFRITSVIRVPRVFEPLGANYFLVHAHSARLGGTFSNHL
jgi:hypothetical protein